jgi:hypothetical protein
MEDPVQAVVGTGVAALLPHIPSNATSILPFGLVVRVEPLLSSEVRADLTTGEASDLAGVAMPAQLHFSISFCKFAKIWRTGQ